MPEGAGDETAVQADVDAFLRRGRVNAQDLRGPRADHSPSSHSTPPTESSRRLGRSVRSHSRGPKSMRSSEPGSVEAGGVRRTRSGRRDRTPPVELGRGRSRTCPSHRRVRRRGVRDLERAPPVVQQRRWWLPVVGRAGRRIDGRAAPSHGLPLPRRTRARARREGEGVGGTFAGQIFDARRAA